MVNESQHAFIRARIRDILRGSKQTRVLASAVLISTSAAASPQEAPSADPSLSEVVVTAQRRTQSVQDIPYNISVVEPAQLGSVSNLTGLSQLVPGLANVDTGPAARGGNNDYVLRGLRADAPGGFSYTKNFTVSPVAVYFGETPVNFTIPMDDIERIEVLRGPQGTLYGSGSLAGTIRVIPKRPSFDAVSGDVRVNGGWTQDAPNGNADIHGVLNVPLSDQLAIRIVSSYDREAGFIDAADRVRLGAAGVPVPSVPGDLTSGFILEPVQKGANSSDQWTTRASLRWQPITAFDAQLDYLHQKIQVRDAQLGSRWAGGPWDTSFGVYPDTTINTRPGCDTCNTAFRPEPYSGDLDLVDLSMSADVGFATIVSATSFYRKEDDTAIDGTGQFYTIPGGSLFIPFYPYQNFPRLTQPDFADVGERAFTQELRLVSKGDHFFDYTAGAYYQHQKISAIATQYLPGQVAYNEFIGLPTPSPTGDLSYQNSRATTFTDKALFGELTAHATSQWQITLGLRALREEFSSNVVSLIPVCGAICAADLVDPYGRSQSAASQHVSKLIKKLNTSYDVGKDLKVYATYSEGFRRGGVAGVPLNGPFASRPDLDTFQPDIAKNYEVGVKGTALNRRIRFLADAYLINLDNFQFNSYTLSSVPAAFNGPKARSKGVELEVHAALSDRLTTGVGYAYTNSEVAQAFDIVDYLPYALVPGGNGEQASIFGGPVPKGAKLPGVSAHVATVSADYQLPSFAAAYLTGQWALHLDGQYRSSQQATLTTGSVYSYTIPSAFIANARITFATSEKFSYQFYVNNLTNNAGITGAEYAQTFQNPYMLVNVGRPRTFGAGIHYSFGM